MGQASHRVAILHDDQEIVERVSRLAAIAGLDIIRPHSFSALVNQIDDPLLSAVVIELTAPREGGLDILKRLYSPFSRAAIVVIAALDATTAETVRRLAESRGLDIAVFRRHAIDDRALARQLCAGRDLGPRFGPAELDDSIEKHYFRVEYQPKVPVSNASMASQFGVEALCRVLHPQFGDVSPDRFVPMAEKCGLILKLTDAVACEALRAWRSWQQADLFLKLSINVSPELLREGEWSDLFLKRCAEFKVEPKWITLEITESAAGATDPAACEILTALRRKGFTLSIDDFGIGFSSLSTLHRLPVSELKIDKSFILELEGSAVARTLVESTVSMAQRIGIKVVAEGVESESVFRELRQIGCHEAQGYFIGKSMPAEDVVQFFTGWKTTLPTPSPQAAPCGLPKIAIVQMLMNDILNHKDAQLAVPFAWPRTGPLRRPDGDDTEELMQKIPPLVLDGRTLPAVALCHTIAHRFDKSNARSDILTKILQLQRMLEEELLTTADLELRV